MSLEPQFDIALDREPLFTVGRGSKAKPEVLARSLRTLAMILRVGGSEVGALEAVGEQFEQYSVGDAYSNAAELMRTKGASFAQAMLAQDVFPRTVRELIVATPNAAQMHKSLTTAARIVQESRSVKKKLVTNMIQPGIMLGMCIVFLFLASWLIIPGILGAFDTLGTERPLSAEIVVAAAGVTTWVIGALIVVILLAALFWAVYGRNSDTWRALMDRLVNRIPVVGEIVQLSTASRMFEILAANLNTGRSEWQSLESAGAGSGSEALRQHCNEHAARMRNEGARLRDFANTELIPLNAEHMLQVAPSIRQEVEILTQLAPEYQKEAEQQLEQFSRTIEPLMNYAVYSVAAVLILAVVIPMYSMFPAIMEMGNSY